MTLIVCVPRPAPGIDVGWLLGSATKGILNLVGVEVLNTAERYVKSTPVLPYWFDSHTYGVRPVNMPIPPRTWRRLPLVLLRSQLNPTRGENIVGAGTTLVA